jgi:hypothetical protein
MYGILTGLYPFYNTIDQHKVAKKIKNGETAVVDPRFHNRSFAEGKLAEIIPLCWEFDPDKRIDIFHLVELLREAYKENQQRMGSR